MLTFTFLYTLNSGFITSQYSFLELRLKTSDFRWWAGVRLPKGQIWGLKVRPSLWLTHPSQSSFLAHSKCPSGQNIWILPYLSIDTYISSSIFLISCLPLKYFLTLTCYFYETHMSGSIYCIYASWLICHYMTIILCKHAICSIYWKKEIWKTLPNKKYDFCIFILR